MGVGSSNIANVQQEFMNNISQQTQQNCLSYSKNISDGNVIIVSGSTVNGDFVGVSSGSSTDSTCLMVSNMEDSISNILASVLQQTNEAQTDWFNGFQVDSQTNSFNINQSVTNNISQINEATCSANTTQSASDNYIYVANTKIGGNFVGVSSTSSASANCNMTNNMKNTTYNQAQSTVNQDNTVKGMFVSMVAAFATLIGIMVIGVIILFSVGPIRRVGYTAQKREPNLEREYRRERRLTEKGSRLESSYLTPENIREGMGYFQDTAAPE